jgi:hypothetical protein
MNIGPENIKEAELIWPGPLVQLGMLMLYPRNENDIEAPISIDVWNKTVNDICKTPLVGVTFTHVITKPLYLACNFFLRGFSVMNIQNVYLNSKDSKRWWLYSVRGFFQTQPSPPRQPIIDDLQITQMLLLHGTSTRFKNGEIKSGIEMQSIEKMSHTKILNLL